MAARGGSSAEYVVASAASLPFADCSFDVVVSRLVLHHLSGEVRTEALDEMLRVLRPGGRVLVADIASRAARSGHHLAAHLLGSHHEPEHSLQRVLWQAGFREVTQRPAAARASCSAWRRGAPKAGRRGEHSDERAARARARCSAQARAGRYAQARAGLGA